MPFRPRREYYDRAPCFTLWVIHRTRSRPFAQRKYPVLTETICSYVQHNKYKRTSDVREATLLTKKVHIIRNSAERKRCSEKELVGRVGHELPAIAQQAARIKMR